MTGEVPGASYVGDPPATPADPPSADPATPDTSTEVAVAPASEPGTPSSQIPKKGKDARLKTLDADIQAKLKERHDLDTELETRRRALADVRPPTAPSPVSAKPAQDDPEPDHTDATKYPEGQYDLGYIKAQARWEARQEFRQQSASADQRRRAETLEQVSQRTQATFASEVKAAIDADPTFGELLSTSEAEVPADPTHPMTHVIMTSPVKVALLRHFAEHPEDSTRLAAMASRDDQGQWRGNPMGLYGEMKKLEGRLEALGAQPPASAPKTVSSAPPPPPTLGSKATAPVDEMDAAIARGDFATFNRLETARVIARAAGR